MDEDMLLRLVLSIASVKGSSVREMGLQIGILKEACSKFEVRICIFILLVMNTQCCVVVMIECDIRMGSAVFLLSLLPCFKLLYISYFCTCVFCLISVGSAVGRAIERCCCTGITYFKSIVRYHQIEIIIIICFFI